MVLYFRIILLIFWFFKFYFTTDNSSPSYPPHFPLIPILRKGKELPRGSQQSLAHSAETRPSSPFASPLHVSRMSKAPHHVEWASKIIHALELDPDPTTRGSINRPDFKTVTHMQRACFGPMQDSQLSVSSL